MSRRVEQSSLPAVVVPLTDGWDMAECVRPDGTTGLWLLGEEDAAPGCCCETCAPHERTGRLPQRLRDRLGLIHRCGGTTRAGAPCRQVVPQPGSRCATHRTVT